MPINTIHLNGYTAEVPAPGFLSLGTKESHGIEKIQVIPGPEWDGLVITATFVTPRSATRVVVPENGVMDVPPEATALYLNTELPGIIVFAGTSDGVQRISTNAGYIVADHAPVEGDSSQPIPSEWEQLVSRYQSMLNTAVPPGGTPGYVLGATEDGNAWVPQTGGGTPSDAYTKSESDARYAPIAAAIQVSDGGTGIASLSPTVAWGMQGLKIYGRSWKNGTPDSEGSTPVVSAGSVGSVDLSLINSNLIVMPTGKATIAGISFDSDGEKISLEGIATGTQRVNSYFLQNPIHLYPGKYTLSMDADGVFDNVECTLQSATGSNVAPKFASASNPVSLELFEYTTCYFCCQCKSGQSVNCTIFPILSAGSDAVPWTPKRSQQFSISTPNGLPGVPVNSGGDWTDENGKQWISDVVDFAARTKTQYCGQIASYNGEEITTPYISSTGDLTTGAQVVYVLPEPVTTPLDAATISAYQALQSYPGATNVVAPDCGIEAAAVGDATQIIADINRKLAAL